MNVFYLFSYRVIAKDKAIQDCRRSVYRHCSGGYMFIYLYFPTRQQSRLKHCIWSVQFICGQRLYFLSLCVKDHQSGWQYTRHKRFLIAAYRTIIIKKIVLELYLTKLYMCTCTLTLSTAVIDLLFRRKNNIIISLTFSQHIG